MRILLLNQYFTPDVAATAQHAGDLASELAASGHAVTVVTGRRSSSSRSVLYPAREVLGGVEVIRVDGSGFGKTARWRRAADFGSFLAACAWRMFRLPAFDAVLAMTTPPLVSVLGAATVMCKGGELHLWLMDMNPDEAIAAGWLRPGSLPTRALDALHRFSLRRAGRIVVLDRFMRDRVEAKGVPTERIDIVPPWSHDTVRWDPAGREAFRREHGLESKFVVMYSGNHSPCHPLDSLLEAALRMRNEPALAFCFAGGGSEFTRVRAFAREHGLDNIVTLPYQPLERLSASLSAADLHAVVMGDPFVGIVHPCKIYNVMALGLPVLYIGPDRSHVADLGAPDWLYSARHGDVRTICAHVRSARLLGHRRYRSECELADSFSQSLQLSRLAEKICGTVADKAAEDAACLVPSQLNS